MGTIVFCYDLLSKEVARAGSAAGANIPDAADNLRVDYATGWAFYHMKWTPNSLTSTPARMHNKANEKLVSAGPASEGDASRYRALVDLAYDAIITMDAKHNITLFNRAAESLFGYSAAEILGKPVLTLLPQKFRANHSQRVQHFSDNYQAGLRQATPPRMDESNNVFGQRRDGSVIPVEIAVSKVDLNGTVEFMAVVRDISERVRLIALLKKQAGTDELTGLPNRRRLLEFVEGALVNGDHLSVFILDIDCFKEINDRYGHDGGDKVLRALAREGEATLATTGTGPPVAAATALPPEAVSASTAIAPLFSRWGGEEFVAALPGVTAPVAYNIADQLRARIAHQESDYDWQGEPIPFTVSIGLVTCDLAHERFPGIDVIMKRADRALYRAKSAGRNRVEVG